MRNGNFAVMYTESPELTVLTVPMRNGNTVKYTAKDNVF